MSTQRPPHNPSKNLTLNELQCLYDLLEPNCVTLATAVAQILYGSDNTWKKHSCGVLCYIKDYNKRSYCLRLYDLRSKKAIFEELIVPSVSLKKSLDLFYTFDGLKDKIGINFVDQNEADTFCKLFHEKQQYLYKKTTDHKLTNTQQTSISSLANGIKPPTNALIKASVSPQMTEKKIKSKPVKNEKNKRKRPVTISGPLPDSFIHILSVGKNASFINDATQQELFEKVLTGMKMTPEEEIYVRKTIKNTEHGLEKIFTKTSHHNDTPPEIPPRTYTLLQGSNHSRIPFQDISMPTLTYNQKNKNPPPPPQLQNTSNESEKSASPIVPPRPTRHVLNNTQQQPNKTSRAPPPPPSMPTELPNLSIPIAPPLPPPAPPIFLIEQTPNPTLTVPANTEHNSLLKEICNFNTVKLKPASDRPTTIPKPSENTSNVDAQKTLEENIRDLLEKRRKELMGSDDEENESDSNDDEWCD